MPSHLQKYDWRQYITCSCKKKRLFPKPQIAAVVELLEKQQSKMEVIVTFLILLEMIKVGSIDVCQEEVFGDINITYKAPMTVAVDLSEKQE